MLCLLNLSQLRAHLYVRVDKLYMNISNVDIIILPGKIGNINSGEIKPVLTPCPSTTTRFEAQKLPTTNNCFINYTRPILPVWKSIFIF